MARSDALWKYWTTVSAVNHNRDLWPSFLSRNHLPADTPHGAEIVAAEKALLDSLRDGPSEMSGALGQELADAYVQERKQTGTRLEITEADYHARKSPCPAPATRTSGTDRVSMQQLKRSADEFYPDVSRRDGLEGRVIVALHVSREGCVSKLAIAGSSGSVLLDDAALEYAETFEYLPAAVGGKATESSTKLAVMFKLDQGERP
jgi:TonB family protein